ncbi:DUF5680 domain-containing protein [Oryzifoliimicrobium ureilyticus]|uniref:DUF5680 domain-containing protein n=1 Tax=Oryzifoliimicrobium ureilyticus TaxID=3113724 RepID=UPI00307666BD
MIDLDLLNRTIVAAKAASYVGGGKTSPSSREGSHDLAWTSGDWRYLDSYFGGTDFIGQEVLWFCGEPVWAMNYYGYITRADLIDGTRAGDTIRAALSEMYRQGRFLGGFDWSGPSGVYRDRNEGDAFHFKGRETIAVAGTEAYALDYSGGLIRP